MESARVDPRDITWEVDHPVYRVHLWTQDGSACDEWRLAGATTVHDAIAWAQERVGRGRSYQLFIEVPAERGLGLVRLHGTDPTSHRGS